MKLKNACICTQHTFTISVKTGITGMKSAHRTQFCSFGKLEFRLISLCLCAANSCFFPALVLFLLSDQNYCCRSVRESNKPNAIVCPKPTSTVQKWLDSGRNTRKSHKSFKMHKIYFLFLSDGKRNSQLILVVIV